MNAAGAPPRQIRLLTPRDYRSMPWRNGRGTTVELMREDASEGTLLWRVSMADVVEAGDFSRFPGVDRILMLIDGAGFDLRFEKHGKAVPVRPFVPMCFSGDWTTRAEAVRGPSRDLNVMVARGRVRADLAVYPDVPFSNPLADRSLFLALQGQWMLRVDSETRIVDAGDMLVVRDGKPADIAGEGSGVLVRIDLWFDRLGAS